MAMKKQIFTAFTVNLLTLIYGFSNGWIAPNLVRFQSKDSPIGLITADEASLIVSSLCIGGFVGTLVFGLLADLFGRKWTLLVLAVPQIAANVLLAIGTSTYYVYAARILFGLAGGGVFTLVPIFVSEISHESIRGALGTLLSLVWTLGIVLGYVLASWMDYFLVPIVSAAIGLVFILIFVWLPESPDYLSHTQQTEKAKLSYTFYGNHRIPNGGEVVSQKITWRDFKDPAVRRGCCIAFTLIFFADTCGVFTITNYMTELLQWADLQLDVYVTTVALGLLQILGCVISAFCMDRCGRRILFMISALVTGLALYAFGFYYYLLDQASISPSFQSLVLQLKWLPIVSLALAILAASLAIGAAPFFLIAELLPMKLRSRVTTMGLAVSWLVAFTVVHSFHSLVYWFGVEGAYWIYGSVCLVEFVYVYFCLPETKNLTIDQIQSKLGKAKTIVG